MSILNTFYIMFRSNASDVVKGNKEISKSTKETVRDLKNTNDEAKSLGETFVKIVETGAAAAGAWAGFKILENGVKTAADYNAQLAIMARNYGQNAEAVKKFGQAAYEAGGTREGGIGDLNRFNNISIGRGAGPVSPDQLLANARARLKPFQGAQRLAMITQRMGFTDTGNITRLMMNDGDFAASDASAGSVSKLSKEDQQKNIDLMKERRHLEGAEDNLFSTIGNTLIPAINALVDKISGVINGVAGSAGGSLAAGAGLIAGKGLEGAAGAYGFFKVLKLLKGGAAAAPAAEVNLGGAGFAGAAGGITAGVLGLGALGVGELAYGLHGIYKTWNPAMQELKNAFSSKKSGNLASTFNSGGDDMAFWMSQGYTREQAAGIIANMQAESGGNVGARGDGGRAAGLFQWHPSRRNAILKATGIDVMTAGRQDQLRAAAWEMKNGDTGFNDSHYRTLKGADAAGGYFSQNFEHPANAGLQAARRGQAALGLVSGFGGFGGGSGTTVKIDKIEISTQATDAAGIAGSLESALMSKLSFLRFNHDDGVAK